MLTQKKDGVVIYGMLAELFFQCHYRYNVDNYKNINDHLSWYQFLTEIVMLHFRKKNMENLVWKQYRDYTENNTIPFYVYIMHDTSNNLYKIGKAVNPHERLNNFKTGNASIKLLNYYPGFMADEKIIHLKFNKHRVEGEWFKLKQKHLDKIDKYFKSKPYYYENTLEENNES